MPGEIFMIILISFVMMIYLPAPLFVRLSPKLNIRAFLDSPNSRSIRKRLRQSVSFGSLNSTCIK